MDKIATLEQQQHDEETARKLEANVDGLFQDTKEWAAEFRRSNQWLYCRMAETEGQLEKAHAERDQAQAALQEEELRTKQ
ncbi:hypothetical protein ACP70R_015356 [Stipagrostis hirtigluma subsp. patula]